MSSASQSKIQAAWSFKRYKVRFRQVQNLIALPFIKSLKCNSTLLAQQGAYQKMEAMLKAIHAGEDIAAAREKAIRVIEKLRGLRLSRAAELVEAAVEETLTYYAFPEEHWRRIRTNNPLERILREIRRRTRVVGAFPDGQSALNLAAARLRHIAGTAWSMKRYLNIELLKDQQMRGAITA
jgi:putative transposase